MEKENFDVTNGAVQVPNKVLCFLSDTDTFTFDDLVSTVSLGAKDAFDLMKYFLKNGIASDEGDGVFRVIANPEKLKELGDESQCSKFSEEEMKELGKRLPMESFAVLGKVLNGKNVTYGYVRDAVVEVCRYDLLTLLVELEIVVCEDGNYYSAISEDEAKRLSRFVTRSASPENPLANRIERYSGYKWQGLDDEDEYDEDEDEEDYDDEFEPSEMVSPDQVGFILCEHRGDDVDVAVIRGKKKLSYYVPFKFFSPAYALRTCLNNNPNKDVWEFLGFDMDILAVDFFEVGDHSPEDFATFYLVTGENERLEIDGYEQFIEFAPKILYDMLKREEEIVFEIEFDTETYRRDLKCHKTFPCEIINEDGMKLGASCCLTSSAKISAFICSLRNNEDDVKRFFGVKSTDRRTFEPANMVREAYVEVCGEVKKIDPKVSIRRQLTDEEIDYLADRNFAVFHMTFASEV